MKTEILLTGIRPTSNTIHIWNYFWVISPLYEYAKLTNNLDNTYIFIADLHWIIWHHGENLKQNIISQYAIYKAIWFKNIFLQSDILSITQIEKYLNSYINLWRLLRLHSIKEYLKEKELGTLKLDLFNYPVLMSADILWLQATHVFLWKDQKQHLEITREIAKKMKKENIPNIIIPEGVFFEGQDNQVIWLDWRKMSKSYKNYIDPFASDKILLSQINKIQTDNIPLWEAKSFDKCNIMKILKFFANEETLTKLRRRYQEGTIWYWEAKKILFQHIKEYFSKIKSKKEEFEKLDYLEIRRDLLNIWNKVSENYNLVLNSIKKQIF